jgi:hypothetical protein
MKYDMRKYEHLRKIIFFVEHIEIKHNGKSLKSSKGALWEDNRRENFPSIVIKYKKGNRLPGFSTISSLNQVLHKSYKSTSLSQVLLSSLFLEMKLISHSDKHHYC